MAELSERHPRKLQPFEAPLFETPRNAEKRRKHAFLLRARVKSPVNKCDSDVIPVTGSGVLVNR